MNDLFVEAKNVRNSINNAIGNLNSFVNILKQNINVNGETLDDDTIKKLSNQLYNSLYYVNNTVIPTARNSGDS